MRIIGCQEEKSKFITVGRHKPADKHWWPTSGTHTAIPKRSFVTFVDCIGDLGCIKTLIEREGKVHFVNYLQWSPTV